MENKADGQEVYQGQEVLKVDFEGCTPSDSDLPAILNLLQYGTFKNAESKIDIKRLAHVIVNCNTVSTVLKQDLSHDDDEEDDDYDVCYALCTVLNLCLKDRYPILGELANLIRDIVTHNGRTEDTSFLTRILNNVAEEPVGVIINDRMQNLNTGIAAPLFRTLLADIKASIKMKMPYNFKYLILVAKLKPSGEEVNEEENFEWVNPEEESFLQYSLCTVQFSVTNESNEDAHRKIMIFSSEHLEAFVHSLEDE